MVSIATRSLNGHNISASKLVTSRARIPPSKDALGPKSAKYHMLNLLGWRRATIALITRRYAYCGFSRHCDGVLNYSSSVSRAIVGCSRPSASSMMRLSTLMRKLVKRMASVPAWKLSKKWRMSYHRLLYTSCIERFNQRTQSSRHAHWPWKAS